LASADALVVGLPRGGVIVAAEVAATIGASLDVIIVQKIGHPLQPELALGALGEGGARVIDDHVRSLGVDDDALARAEEFALTQLEQRVRRFRRGAAPQALRGRHIVIVDDGVATGASAVAACRVATASGAGRVTVAVPVAPHGWETRFDGLADDLIALSTPRSFGSVGRFYEDFRQTTDDEVLACLAARRARPPESQA
jgi:predicted phosphoribosyltransferase